MNGSNYATGVLFLLGISASMQPALPADDASSGLRCQRTEDSITVTAGDKPVVRYNIAVREAPAGIDPVYRRSGYLHPIWTPSGHIVSGDFAPDHPHQHALFYAFVNTTFEGREVDFWNQLKQTGRISHQDVVSVESDDETARFVVTQLHEDLSAPEGPKPVLRETWTVTVRRPAAPANVIDLKSTLRVVADSSLTVNQYHYGGLALRGSSEFFRDQAAKQFNQWTRLAKSDPTAALPGLDEMGHEYLTSEGARRHDGNHTRARWVDLYGSVEGQPVGTTILGHPGNQRAPLPVRLHPHKPYFCFAPMVNEPFELQPDQEYTSRFRILAHDGEPDVDWIEQQYDAFASEQESPIP